MAFAAIVVLLSTAPIEARASGEGPGLAADRAPTLRVELDLFSGRPNPTWDLDEATSKALLAELETQLARGRSVAAPKEAGLGYRGIRLARSNGAPGASWRLFEGRIQGDGGRWVEDPGRAIERRVLKTAPPALEAQLGPVLREILR